MFRIQLNWRNSEIKSGTALVLHFGTGLTSFDIRPTIEEANRIAPAFSRIFKEMILFTSQDKPLPRAGKGTVLRKAAVNLYSPEIEAMCVLFLV